MSAQTQIAQNETSRTQALIARGSGIEKIIYAAIGRAIALKPWKALDAKGFNYHEQSLAVLFVFIVLSAVEVFIIDFVDHRWMWARIPLLIIGIWGLAWMVGLLCPYFMRPYTVGSEGIRVHDGLDLDVHVTWDDQAEGPELRAHDAKLDRRRGRRIPRHDHHRPHQHQGHSRTPDDDHPSRLPSQGRRAGGGSYLTLDRFTQGLPGGSTRTDRRQCEQHRRQENKGTCNAVRGTENAHGTAQ